jgi:capsular polysaccharide biosynthesis protein
MISRFFSWIRRLLQASLLSSLPGSSLGWGPPRRSRTSAGVDLRRSSARYIEVYPASSFVRPEAKTCDRIVPSVFREATVEQLPPDGTFLLHNGRVFGSDPAIITADDAVLLDVSRQWAPYHAEVYQRWKLPPLTNIDGPVLILAASPGYNYCHWFQQMLPRLALAEAAGFQISDFTAVVINRGAPFIQESLNLLGVPIDRCVLTGPEMHCQGSLLVVPTIPPSGNPPRWVADYLRRSYWPMVQINNTCLPDRLYISRSRAPSRTITNEPELQQVLSAYGFTSLCLEELPLLQQIELFANAQVVCGLHGAGLTNTFFSRPGMKLIEIVQPQFPVICYWSWAAVCDLDYYFVLGDGPVVDYMDWSRYQTLNHLDLSCDPAKLAATFQRAGL